MPISRWCSRNSAVTTVQTASTSLLALLNDILDLSKVEAGKLALADDSFDLPQCVRDAMSTLKLRADEHAVLLLTECGRPGEWADLVREGANRAFDASLSDGRVVQALAVGAAINLALAANLLAARVRPLVLAMAVWGAVLAAVPLAAGGGAEYHVCLLRAAQAGAPLALFFWWFCAIREQPPIVVPATA